MSKYKKSYSMLAVNRKNKYASKCGASGGEGKPGFQPGNTCGGDGDGKNTSGDQGGGDVKKWDSDLSNNTAGFIAKAWEMGAYDDFGIDAGAEEIIEKLQGDFDSLDEHDLRQAARLIDEGMKKGAFDNVALPKAPQKLLDSLNEELAQTELGGIADTGAGEGGDWNRETAKTHLNSLMDSELGIAYNEMRDQYDEADMAGEVDSVDDMVSDMFERPARFGSAEEMQKEFEQRAIQAMSEMEDQGIEAPGDYTVMNAEAGAGEGGGDKPKGWDEAKSKIGEHITGQYGDMDKPQYYPYIDEFYAPFKDENGNFTEDGLSEAHDALVEATGGDDESASQAISVAITNQGKFPDNMSQEGLEFWAGNLASTDGEVIANEILAESGLIMDFDAEDGNMISDLTGAGELPSYEDALARDEQRQKEREDELDAAIDADSDELEKGRNELQAELDEQREMYEDQGLDTSFLDEQQAKIDKMGAGEGTTVGTDNFLSTGSGLIELELSDEALRDGPTIYNSGIKDVSDDVLNSEIEELGGSWDLESMSREDREELMLDAMVMDKEDRAFEEGEHAPWLQGEAGVKEVQRDLIEEASGAGEGGITPEQQSQLAEDALSKLNPTDRQTAEAEIQELGNYSFDYKSDVQEYLDGQYGSPGEGVSPEITDAIWEGIGGERTQGGWVGKDRPAPSADTGAGEGGAWREGDIEDSVESIIEGIDPDLQRDTGGFDSKDELKDYLMRGESPIRGFPDRADTSAYTEEVWDKLQESGWEVEDGRLQRVDSDTGAGEGGGATGSGSREEAFNLYKEDYGDDASEDDFNDAYQGHWEVEKDSMGREIPVGWAKDWVEQIGGVSEAISQDQIQSNTDYDKWNAELDNYGEGYAAEQNLDTGKWEVYDRQDSDMPPTEYEYGFEAEDAAKEMNNDILDEMIVSGGDSPSGESYAEKYFNYQRWARDLIMGGEISVENGHVFWNR